MVIVVDATFPPVIDPPGVAARRQRRLNRLRRVAIRATAALMAEERWRLDDGRASTFISEVRVFLGREAPPAPTLKKRRVGPARQKARQRV